ncbi:MAG: LytTR family DNA-binding domain-containing protein [Saprospiraceae bacterium]
MNVLVQTIPDTYSVYTFRAALERIVGLEAQIQKLQHSTPQHNLVIRIHQSRRIISILTLDILYIRAEDNYSRIYLKNGYQYYVCRTLKSLAAEVPSSDFLRCHRTYLVNRSDVREINRCNHEIILANGIRIPMARRFLKGCVEGIISR